MDIGKNISIGYDTINIDFSVTNSCVHIMNCLTTILKAQNSANSRKPDLIMTSEILMRVSNS